MCLRDDSHRGKDKPHRGLTALTAGLLALGLALLLAAPAGAEARKFRFGVFGQAIRAADLSSMGDGNVRTLRTIFSWGKAEAASGGARACTGGYDEGVYDALVGEASRQGASLLPVMVGSPGYVPGRKTNAPPTRSKVIRHYKCFVRKLVARYGPGGDFIREQRLLNPTQPVRPIRSWQVWNEPNLRAFAARRNVSPREYGRLLKITTGQIRGEDPRANIVLAGMPELVHGGMNARTFLRRLYRVKRIKRKFDVVAIHPFARNHKGVKGALIRIRRELRKLGDRRRAMWVTETGWATGGPEDSFFVKSERGQATQLNKTFRMLRRNRRRFKLGSVHWYSWRDTVPASSGGGWQSHSGLYRKDGTPKRSCHTFVRFTGGDRPCRRIEAPGAVAGSLEALEPRGSTAQVIPSPPE